MGKGFFVIRNNFLSQKLDAALHHSGSLNRYFFIGSDDRALGRPFFLGLLQSSTPY